MKKLVILFLIFTFSFPFFAEISFGEPDLNKNDEILFTVKQNYSGTNPYTSIMYAKIKDGVTEKLPEVLTCYPEQMELLFNSTVLQIRNRYGTARYNIKDEALRWKNIAQNLPENTAPQVAYKVSNDGKWYCYVVKKTVCTGDLIVENAENGSKTCLSEVTLNNYDDIPVKWTYDSSLLIYEKNGNIYFCNPQAVLQGVEIEEKYRKIGKGTINSVEWADERYLAYIDDCILYKINTKELYTLGLYAGIIGQGTAIGRLPFNFNPKTDKFSSNKDLSGIVVVQSNRLYTYMTVKKDRYDYMDVIYSKPYTDSNASISGSYIFWDEMNVPVLWQEKLPYDGTSETGSVYRIGSEITQVLEIKESGKPFISPDGKRVAFFAGSVIYVYDITTWKRVAELSGEKIVSALWLNRNVLYVGGEKTLKKWNLLTDKIETISLSQAEDVNWNYIENTIVAKDIDNNYYRYNKEKGTWSNTTLSIPLQKTVQNGRYRVFTGKTPNKKYLNTLYIRTLSKKAVTKPVYAQSAKKSEDKKRVALVFDAYDNSDGLTTILSILKKYNIPGTFYINGEFIRRYPSETRQIVLNGYDCASMFFSQVDLTDKSFVIDEDFIRRGLARNEDEFYQVTGKEFLLYWHAPMYLDDDKIIAAGEQAGYSYTKPVYNFNAALKVGKSEKPEQVMIDYYNVIKASKGGVVPITIGYSKGTENSPVYEKLDVLICTLIDDGYEFISINDL